MQEKELRRSLAVLPIGTVMELTGLSARQIRYYETNELVIPKRKESKHRLYSLDDVDRLLEIKDYLSQGRSIAEIKTIFNKAKVKNSVNSLSDSDIRKMLAAEMLNIGGFKPDNHFFDSTKL